MGRTWVVKRLSTLLVQLSLVITSFGGAAVFALVRQPVIPAQAISPSSVSEFQPNTPTKFGGRTTAIDVNPTNTSEAVAGTESGGLFKTKNGGANWTHLDGLIPFRINDVKYSDDGLVLLATTNPNADNSFPGGIWRSTDGGTSWTQPATAATLCGGNTTAYAIGFEGGSNEAYAGVQCGLAYSSDKGATWSLLSMSQVGPIVAPSASEIDLCAGDGFHRFSRSGSTLTQQVSSSVGGNSCDVTHDLAVAPQETSVIYSVAGPGPFNLYESDDNGSTWHQVDTGLDGGTRQSLFVGTHVAPGGGNSFTIIYGASLGGPYLGGCTANVSGSRCVNLNTTRTTINVAHSDQDQVVFRTDGSNCAQYISSDGGVQTTTDCGKNFVMAAGSGSSNGGFNALEVYDLTGQTHPGLATDLYFGTQDNDAYGSADSGSTWPGHSCCDAADISVVHTAPNNSKEVATFDEIGGKGQAAASPGLLADQSWPNPPQTCATGGCQYQNPWVIGPGVWVQAVNPGGVNPNWYFWVATVTGTVPSISVSWSGPATDSHGNPFGAPGLDWRPRIVGPASDPILFIGQSNGSANGILKITGLLSNTMTGTLLTGTGSNRLYRLAGYGDNFIFTDSFAVDPGNSQHLIAYDAGDGGMKITTDGGVNWITNQQLTNLVGGAGRYCPNCEFAQQQSEARAIRFDPTNPNRILVGTDNAGIIASVDGGNTWTQMLGSSVITDITDFFFDEVQKDVLVSSYGRGLWKLDMTQRAATIVYTGDTNADYHDSATLSAHLYDSVNGASSPIVGASVNLALGSQSCSGVTDAGGRVSCVIPSINQIAGSNTATASFAGDAQWLATTASVPFNINKEETTLTYTGPTVIANGVNTFFTAVLMEDGTVPINGRPVTITLGTGSSTQSCIGLTGPTGVASCPIVPAQPLGPGTVRADFFGDAFYLPSSASASTIMFAFLSRGAFVIGSGDSTMGSKVDFFGPTWAKQNLVPGGAPNSFKGYASATDEPPACGTEWTTTPGDSVAPPANIPSYMGVVVSDSVSKFGNEISGGTLEIVVVKTSPGYDGHLGSGGTGTVIAIFCQ